VRRPWKIQARLYEYDAVRSADYSRDAFHAHAPHTIVPMHAGDNSLNVWQHGEGERLEMNMHIHARTCAHASIHVRTSIHMYGMCT
jgi:hypothetical protein